MKAKWLLGVAMVVAAAGGFAARAADMGTAFTYQGSLEKPAGTPVTGVNCEFVFGLFDDPTTGIALASQDIPNVPVDGGVFTVPIDFGAGAFKGTARWLQVVVKCPSDSGYVLLLPRVALTPAPYALALPGLYTQQNGASPPNIIGGSSSNPVAPGVVGAVIGGGGGEHCSGLVGNCVRRVGQPCR